VSARASLGKVTTLFRGRNITYHKNALWKLKYYMLRMNETIFIWDGYINWIR